MGEHGGPPDLGGVGQPTDPVEAALGEALRLAAAAGKWDTVAELGRVLAERQRTRHAPEVPSLDVVRAKRRSEP